MTETQNNAATEVALETIVSNAIQIPGVKVDRQCFLAEIFPKNEFDLQAILDKGPVNAGCSRETLAYLAQKLIFTRTGASSLASFAMGLPGGLAVGATIPADMLQFFGVSLRLAQELAYLYGADDLWKNGEIDNDAVRGQLILYCGVMFGVSGAGAGLRLLSSQLAKNALKKLPQQALMKNIWFRALKQIGKAVGVKITKNTVAKGVSMTIPVIGGAISGGLNFASMLPMAKRLASALDEANFDYSQEEIFADYREIENLVNESDAPESSVPSTSVGELAGKSFQQLSSGFGELLAKGRKLKFGSPLNSNSESEEDVFQKLEKLARLKEMGVITHEEFLSKKSELLTQI